MLYILNCSILFNFINVSVTLRVPRRYSSGAQHSGRGGAGNIFRETEDSNKLARKPSQEQAIDDSADSKDTASPEPEANAAKRKNWIFGKKV